MNSIPNNSVKDKYTRWRKQAKLVSLSPEGTMRLEWMIQYSQGNRIVDICKRFGIHRATFYKWKQRFKEYSVASLETYTQCPKTFRIRSFSPEKDQRVITLRKQYPYYGKEKIKILYIRIYQEDISSWYIQRVIQSYELYPPRRGHKHTTKLIRKRNPRKRITQFKEPISSFGLLLHLDTVEVRIQGKKRYILTAIDSYTRVAFVYAYTNHSSASAKDFLLKLYEIFDGQISHIHTDNGSEFAGYFEQAIKSLGLTHWYSRVRVSKDNAICERFNRTVQDEIFMSPRLFLSSNIYELNVILSSWLIEYLSVRPHTSLNYLTPLQFLDSMSTISSSHTISCKKVRFMI